MLETLGRELTMSNKHIKSYILGIRIHNGNTVPVFTAKPVTKMSFAVDGEKIEPMKCWCYLNTTRLLSMRHQDQLFVLFNNFAGSDK
jgi:hypothetical protein